jgi:hypothetical protein
VLVRDDQVPVWRGHHNDPARQRLAVGRVPGRQLARAGQDARQHAGALGRDVQDNQYRGRETGRQHGDERGQRLDAARGRHHRHHGRRRVSGLLTVGPPLGCADLDCLLLAGSHQHRAIPGMRPGRMAATLAANGAAEASTRCWS